VQKKAQEGINSRLALVIKSGKYTLGYKTALKTLRQGKGAVLLVSVLKRAQVVDENCCHHIIYEFDYVCSEAGNYFQQLPSCSQVRSGVLRHAFEDRRASLLWKYDPSYSCRCNAWKMP
jgi:hypothetical protein